MPTQSTVFNDQVTTIFSAWLNAVNSTVFKALGDGSQNSPQTSAEVLTNLGLTNAAAVAALVYTGTATQVLHGGVGAAYGAVVLTTDISGFLPIGNIVSTAGVPSTQFLRGDGTWAIPSGAGTVTNVAASLPANRLILGNTSPDIVAMASLGTTTTVLHGNAGGAPTFAAVSLTADVSGFLPIANLISTAGAPTTQFLRGDGTWIATGTVTNTSTVLTANAIVLGATAPDIKVMGSLGTTTTVLHGNAAGAPTFGAVVLTADVSGFLPIGNLISTASVPSTQYLRGDGTWQVPTGSGSVTHTAGNLTASALVVGNAVADIAVLASLGTATTVLHGNAAGLPTWAAINLAADVTGLLAITAINAANYVGTGTKFLSDGLGWITPAGAGTVTNAANLTNTALVVGSGGAAIATLSVVGTSTTVLHGNVTGSPTWSAVNLTSDVSGFLPIGNIVSTAAFPSTMFLRGDGTWQVPAGGGSVSSVSTPAPANVLTITNPTTTPVFTMGAATSSLPGYILAADWTTFNGKAALNGSASNQFNIADGTTTNNALSFGQVAASGGSALMGFLQGGTGAGARTVQAKLREVSVNVADFGFGSATTAANNVIAINNAISRVIALGGGYVDFPATTATCNINSTITINADSVRLRGQGAGDWKTGSRYAASSLTWTGSAGGIMILFQPISSASLGQVGCGMTGIFLDGAGSAAYGIQIRSHCRGVWDIVGGAFTTSCMYMGTVNPNTWTTMAANGNAIFDSQSNEVSISCLCDLSSNGGALVLDGCPVNVAYNRAGNASMNLFKLIRYENFNSSVGIDLYDCDTNTFLSIIGFSGGAGTTGLRLNGCNDIRLGAARENVFLQAALPSIIACGTAGAGTHYTYPSGATNATYATPNVIFQYDWLDVTTLPAIGTGALLYFQTNRAPVGHQKILKNYGTSSSWRVESDGHITMSGVTVAISVGANQVITLPHALDGDITSVNITPLNEAGYWIATSSTTLTVYNTGPNPAFFRWEASGYCTLTASDWT